MTLLPPPGKRWTGDRGAIPGEPAYQLDANAKGDGVAALIEIDSDRGSQWMAVVDGGRCVGKSEHLTEAARAAERYIDSVKQGRGR